MTKQEELKIRVNLNLEEADKNVKIIRGELMSLLNDSRAIDEALEKAGAHNKKRLRVLGEGAAKLTKDVFTKDVKGGILDLTDLLLDLRELSTENVPFLERIKNETNKLLRAELELFEAKRRTGELIKLNGEREIEAGKKSSISGKMDYAEAMSRKTYLQEFSELYEEEIENLETNIVKHRELQNAVQELSGVLENKYNKPMYSLFGERNHLPNNFEVAKKELENLKVLENLYAQKVYTGKDAIKAIEESVKEGNIVEELSKKYSEINKKRKREERDQDTTLALSNEKKENYTEQELERINKKSIARRLEYLDRRQIDNELSREEEERFQHLEQLQIQADKDRERAQQAAVVEEELRNRKIEGIKEVEAVEIDASKMHETLAKNNEDIAKREAETEGMSLKERVQQWQQYAQKVSEISQQINEVTSLVTGSLGSMFGQLSASYQQQVEELNEKIAAVDEEKEAALEQVTLSEEEKRTREEELAQQKIDLENATTDEQKAKAQERIATLQGELTAEDTINREYDGKKASLEKEKAKKEKEQKKAEKMQKRIEMVQSIVQSVGNVAQGAAKALSYGPILGPILAAIVTAAGAVQVGIMTKQLAKMEDGGLLRGRRHSQGGMPILGSNVEVEGGEYVVNRQSTGKNLGLLSYINSQRRELSPADISNYFDRQFAMPQPMFSRMFEEGGQLPPQLASTSSAMDRELLDTIKNINFEPKVSVTDINSVQSDMVRVDAWTGM